MNKQAFEKGFLKRAQEYGLTIKEANHVLEGLLRAGEGGLATVGAGLIGHRVGNITGDALKLQDPDNKKALKRYGGTAGVLAGLGMFGPMIGEGVDKIIDK